MVALRIITSQPVQYHVPLFRELARQEVDLEVVFYHPGGTLASNFDVELWRVVQWDVDLLSGYRHRFIISKQASYSRLEQIKTLPHILYQAFRQPRTPVLLVGWFMLSIWLVWAIRILLGLPVAVISETTLQSYQQTPKPRWRTRLLSWLLSHSLCYAIGTNNKAFLEQMGVPASRIVMTPYSIDNGYFAARQQELLADRAGLCREYGLDPDLPTFLFCGKLIPLKRTQDMIKAFQMSHLLDKAQFIFVGDGHLRGELEHFIDSAKINSAHLLGFFNYSQLPIAYALGEVLLLISEETWGLVVNEACACKRPVIVSRTVGCAPDLVGPENGWVLEAPSVDALAQALQEAYNQRGRWSEMGSAGYTRVAGHTFANMAAGVIAGLTMMKSL